MDKENIVKIQCMILFSHNKRCDVICSNVEGTGNYQITKPGTENQHHVSFPCVECAEVSLTDVRSEKLFKRENNCSRMELAVSRKNYRVELAEQEDCGEWS